MRNTDKIHETKRWVLLEQLPFQHSKRLVLILFLYSLAFTLLLVGLRMFCHNLSATAEQNTRENATDRSACSLQNQEHLQNIPETNISQEIADRLTISDPSAQIYPQSQDNTNAERIQQNIADHIIRLHVIAHSDTDMDQTLKLKVRDEVLSHIQASLIPTESKNEAADVLKHMITEIQETAQQKIRQEGFSYDAHVVLEQRYFPAKTYGDLTFPPGTYQALCIEIGEAAGKNWWCVLFPSLCFVDETTAEVPGTSKEKLEDSLSEEAYHSLANQSASTTAPTARPEFHSALYDWIMKR